MFGRDEERQVIDSVLARARSGHSGALVLQGEPGVGKSMLLEYAAESADGMIVLKCAGTETESDLVYGGIHQLLQPVIHLVDRLPEQQRDSLCAVFGFTADRGPDRFLVGAAGLTLLSEASADRPVLCLVDDLQWLDQASAEVVAFVARRLKAESVALLAATRRDPPAALPNLLVDGLDRTAATQMLNAHRGDISPDLVEALIKQTNGNPLALLELANSVTSEQLADRAPLPVTERIQQAFSERVDELPSATRLLLLVAAADDTGEGSIILRAAHALGVPATALDAAQRAELIRLDATERLRFRHPLVRSAIYMNAKVSERLAAHRALADAVWNDLERRAWHLAASTLGTDEGVAADLEEIAARSSRLGGHGTAAAAFERSAELSDAVASRGRRFAAAARAAFDAGQIDRATTLVRHAAPLLDDPLEQAKLTALRASLEVRRGSIETAQRLLVESAGRLAVMDPEQAVVTVPAMIEIGWTALTAREPRYVAELAAGLAELRLPVDHPLTPAVEVHLGLGDLVAGRYEIAVPRIRQRIQDLLCQGSLGEQEDVCLPTFLQEPLLAVGDHPVALDLARNDVTSCRSRGQVGRLPMALAGLAQVEMYGGHHPSVRRHVSEAYELAHDLGQDNVVCLCEGVLASLAVIQGAEEDAQRHIAEAVRMSEVTGLLNVAVLMPRWLGLLDLSLGRPESAFDRLSEAVHAAKLWTHFAALPDLVEAAARAGCADRAASHLTEYGRWASHTGQPWAEAVLHRSRALLATDATDIEAAFDAAVRSHYQAGERDRPHQRGRTQLLYGEWLRRVRRRADARTQLAAAHITFQRLGDTAWAERAAAELRATGKTIQRRDPTAEPKLTPQEQHVVRLAAEGDSNREIAAQLFLSPRTVGYHLSKAFPKLGISSRRQLMRLDIDALTADVAATD